MYKLYVNKKNKKQQQYKNRNEIKMIYKIN